MMEVPCNQQTKVKPKVVLDYNKGKAAVDLSDQFGAYSIPLRKSIKWFRKVGFELIFTTYLANACVLYKLVTENTISITYFKKEVVKHLIRAEETNDCATQTSTCRANHVIKVKKEGNKRTARKMCRNCYKKKFETHGRKYAMNKTRTVGTYCETCKNEPHFCMDCFSEVHK
ncbi:uncharacterized protein [Diabrotica undecimpunctata]|uniref:uncharacterized protein n=1 Tax=Diabrotica undecimpunctata TaxID=50387 RepID=UPI003B634F80